MSTPGVGNMVVGGLVCVVGVGVTLATYSAASGGGRYVVAWGAILFGAIIFGAGAITAARHEAASSRPAAPPGGGAAGTGRLGAGSGLSNRFTDEDWMWIQALASMVHSDLPSAREIAAIRRIMQTLGRLKYEMNPRAEVRDSDVLKAFMQRFRDRDNLATWFRERVETVPLFRNYREDLLRGCFDVMLADGPRPHALATAVMVGQGMGLGEAEVKSCLGDKADKLNGRSMARVWKIAAADAIPGRELPFQYDVLRTCASCKGHGCSVCGETGRVQSKRALTITLPANVRDGMELKCPGRGEDPLLGGRPGDLTLTIKLEPEAKAPVRETGPLNGAAVKIILRLTAAEAVGGRQIEFRYGALTLCTACNGSGCSVCGEQGRIRTSPGLRFVLEPDVHDGMQLTWPGRGDAPLRGGEPGDLHVTIRVDPEPDSSPPPS